MANANLQIILTARDEASKELKKLNTKIKDLAPTFKKMAVIGTAAFTAISAGIGKTVKDAAIAEGAFNKFQTVFAENSDEMLKWIEGIRSEFPSATSEIVSMAAGLGDLLKPIGFTTDEATDMTKKILDLSNKIAAFNDVDPKEVLDSFRSGLIGSSEPLLKFGIDTRVATLEAVALKEGLLEQGQSFNNLEPSVAAVVKAQALYIQATKQSADAIGGFEANNDSFIRRQQELSATLKETSETLGNIFLPIIDKVLKKILPVIQKVADWIEENPKLTKVIIIVVAALAGLVAIVGLLGLALPAIITGFTLLLGPIGLVIVVIAALIAIGVLLVKNWDIIKEKTSEIWLLIGQTVEEALNIIKNVWTNTWDSIKNVVIDVWSGIKNTIAGGIDWIIEKINWVIERINTAKEKAGSVLSGSWRGESNIKGVPFFDRGGIVPGPIGSPQPIMAHGGETVLPTHKDGGGVGQTFNFDFRNANISNIEQLKNDIIAAINRANLLTEQGAM